MFTLFLSSLATLAAVTPATPAPAPAAFLTECAVLGPTTVCTGQQYQYATGFAGTNFQWTLTDTAGGAVSFCGPTNQPTVCIQITGVPTHNYFRLQLNYRTTTGVNTSCAAEPFFADDLQLATIAPQRVCPGEDVTFVVAVQSGTGPFTYAWTKDTGSGPVLIPGANSDTLTLQDVTLADAGSYCASVTGQCETEVACASLSVVEGVVITDLAPQGACVGDDITFTTTVTGGSGPFFYEWTVDHGAGPVVIPGANGNALTLLDVTLAEQGTYCVRVTGECGVASSCAPLLVESCGGNEVFCTLTQGAYGNANGMFNGLRRLELINSLLGTDLVVGKPGRSLKILAGNGSCVIARLPANSTPAAMPAIGDATLSTSTCQTAPVALPLKSNRFKNVLLGQVITLSLNTRLDGDLSGLGICESMTTQLLSAGPDGLMGTADDVANPGPDGVLGTSDDQLTVSIPSTVFTALSALGLPHTVGGLLELANRGLAGQATGGASLSDINGGVDAINRGFDECRALLDCDNP